MSASIRYARSGDVNIAYQVTGDGPFDLVLVSGFFSHLEIDWEHPRQRPLPRAARLVRAPDPLRQARHRPLRPRRRAPRLRDADGRRPRGDGRCRQRARRALRLLGGRADVRPLRRHLPRADAALVLYGTYAKRRDPDDDYPWAPTPRSASALRSSSSGPGARRRPVDDGAERGRRARAWFGRLGRAGLRAPAGARDLILMNAKADVRELLPSVQCRRSSSTASDDRDARVEEGRYIAERIPGARFVELPGDDHVPAIDPDQIVDEVEEFLTGSRPAPPSVPRADDDPVHRSRRLDGAGRSTWATRRGRRCSPATTRSSARELARFSGEELDTAGDGFLASFDGPARAIRCALAIRDALEPLGLRVRAGVHTGEVERRPGEKPRGIAVHLCARVAALAGAGEVLVARPRTISSRARGSRSTTAASTSSRASTAGGASSPFADGAPDDVARILGPCFGRCSSTSTSRCSGRDPSSARRDTSASARGTG